MFCKYCGSKIEDNTKVCSKCGAETNLLSPAKEAGETKSKDKKTKKFLHDRDNLMVALVVISGLLSMVSVVLMIIPSTRGTVELIVDRCVVVCLLVTFILMLTDGAKGKKSK